MHLFIILPVIACDPKSVCGIYPPFFFHVSFAYLFAFTGNYTRAYFPRRHGLAFKTCLCSDIFRFLVFVHFSFLFSYFDLIQSRDGNSADIWSSDWSRVRTVRRLPRRRSVRSLRRSEAPPARRRPFPRTSTLRAGSTHHSDGVPRF